MLFFHFAEGKEEEEEEERHSPNQFKAPYQIGSRLCLPKLRLKHPINCGWRREKGDRLSWVHTTHWATKENLSVASLSGCKHSRAAKLNNKTTFPRRGTKEEEEGEGGRQFGTNVGGEGF